MAFYAYPLQSIHIDYKDISVYGYMLKGGIMLAGDSKAFTFDLEENLFFEKGQEVAELRGIALEPEISIQPYEEYISIRGTIELHGEYEKASGYDEEDQIDLDNFQAKRYVEIVTEEDGVTYFSHRFPVEISVPPYRVTDLNEVTVSIESFDYELPDPSNLKLYASIDIHGINGDIEQQREEDSETVELELEDTESGDADSFHFELRNPNQNETVVAETEFHEEVEVPIQEVSNEAEDESRDNIEAEKETFEQENELEPETDELIINTRDLQVEDESEAEDPDRWNVKSQSLSEFFNQLQTENEAQEHADVAEEQQEELLAQETEITTQSDNQSLSYEQQSEVADASYLSDIFRDTEEEKFTKMRLCIVQDQDTIETIAQRFSISPLQLIKQNQLEDDFEVHEGQLLYIPVKAGN